MLNNLIAKLENPRLQSGGKASSVAKETPDAGPGSLIFEDTKPARLDKIVAGKLGISRRAAETLINQGRILVNDKLVDKSHLVEKGDHVDFPSKPTAATLAPLDLKIPVIFEDDDVLVLNKPAGITVHPTALSDNRDSDLRPGIVHRLDKPTSGVLVIAKTESALKNLQAQFKNHLVKKEYLALVEGKILQKTGFIDIGIGKGDFGKFAVDEEGKESFTEYEVESVLTDGQKDFSLVRVIPRSGRTHQIRVHFAFHMHPLVGDRKYGNSISSELFLHAAKLRFKHPKTEQILTFEAPLPDKLKKYLDSLKPVK